MVSKLNEFRKRFTLLKTNKEIEQDIKQMAPVFRKEAEKLGFDKRGLPDHDMRVLGYLKFFMKFGNFSGICDTTVIWINGFRYRVSQKRGERTVCHELMHELSYHGGTHHGWEAETIKFPEKYAQIKEKEQEWNNKLLAAVEKGKKDVSVFTSEGYGSILKRLSETAAELYSTRWFIPHWLVEGATNVVAYDIVEGTGSKWGALRKILEGSYVLETIFASMLKRVVGAERFYKSFFNGDLNIIADEYCRIKSIKKDGFYNAFGFDILLPRATNRANLFSKYVLHPTDVLFVGSVETVVAAARLALLEIKAKSAQ